MTTLLVASTGGHLAELYDLVSRPGIGDRRWITFDGVEAVPRPGPDRRGRRNPGHAPAVSTTTRSPRPRT